MINLLPPHAKKAIVREYWFRTGAVWAFLIAVACILSALMFVPSVVLLRSHIEALRAEAGSSSELEEKVARAETTVREANLFAGLLARTETRRSNTTIISAIDAYVGSDIALTHYAINRTDLSTPTIALEGIAASREALVTFQESLRAHPLFVDVTVPISDLVRGSNLPFSMELTLSEESYE